MKRLISHLILFLGLLINVLSQAQNVVINEWMSKNSTVVGDEDGHYPDWVEIYNAGANSVDLTGYGISDDARYPFKWVFPQKTLGPNEFLVVFCSDKNRISEPFHTNFKLSGSEDIVLTNNLGYTLSSRHIGSSVFDISEGAGVDGDTEIIEFYQSTPGFTNANGVAHNQISLSHEPGFYYEEFELDLSNPHNHQIRFTTDGSEPDLSSNVWSGSFTLEDRSEEPSSISSIPTTAPNLLGHVLWEEPIGNVFKGTAIRFRSFFAGTPSSHVISGSFFVHPNAELRYSLAVISILTDSLSLFEYDSGIYVPGATYAADPNGGGDLGTGNYHQRGANWERRAHVQLINEQGEIELSQDVGIRIHGAGSRIFPQKSLRIYAREEYGETTIDHEVFPALDEDDFKILLLRNTGQDFTFGMPQDILANELAKELNQATLAFRPVVVFINGEYWGIQNLRERYDHHYLEQFHQLPEDSIDIIENYYGVATKGDGEAFDELYQFLESNDLSIQSNFDYADSKMDMEDFIDNTLIRMYMGCYDWPGNNVRMWRERSATGKFRWLLLDSDVCMGNELFNSLEHATTPDHDGWPNPPESTLFLRKLLENDGFKQRFISRMSELLSTVFSRDNVESELTRLYDIYAPEYNEHNDRWRALPAGQTLEDNYEKLMEVARLRPCYVRQHFMEYFQLSKAEFSFECDSAKYPDPISLLLYPNPNSGSFSLMVPDAFPRIDEVTVIDLSGKLLYKRSTFNEGENLITLSTDHIPSGIYLVNVAAGNVRWNEKLVIQKD